MSRCRYSFSNKLLKVLFSSLILYFLADIVETLENTKLIKLTQSANATLRIRLKLTTNVLISYVSLYMYILYIKTFNHFAAAKMRIQIYVVTLYRLYI